MCDSPWSTTAIADMESQQVAGNEKPTFAHSDIFKAKSINLMKNHADVKVMSQLDPEEDDTGNVEYKFQILPTSKDRFDRLVTQLNWRLTEGGGTCVYELGVLDNGTLAGIPLEDMRKSLSNLCAMAQLLGAEAEIRRLMIIGTDHKNDSFLYVLSENDEAFKVLDLDEGLPDTQSTTGITIPNDSLKIRLDSLLNDGLFRLQPNAHNLHCGDTSANENERSSENLYAQSSAYNAQSVQTPLSGSKSKTPAQQNKLHRRRVLRLGRFEAAIMTGAGKNLSEPSISNVSCSRVSVPPRVPTEEQLLAEVVIQLPNEFFIDYTSL
ncbi:hypothetical protein MGL_2778 [Malassezia globosa CBS 7966]|uniref:Uncharacterized protein n=1 Tax=Malassezia globosa (strain ATCC MYA-4612 / CBS 7966) TaxID=425265 RepID=A8Q5H4_MALGO|nr:uncharacterized protein MGL_2778 [Malassezia globosa CBS 7966]EDP42578.1 hypothetical protein MGL_2778 [Malassezia globosa CBS 7966]